MVRVYTIPSNLPNFCPRHTNPESSLSYNKIISFVEVEAPPEGKTMSFSKGKSAHRGAGNKKSKHDTFFDPNATEYRRKNNIFSRAEKGQKHAVGDNATKLGN